jgi:hypothetical protein
LNLIGLKFWIHRRRKDLAGRLLRDRSVVFRRSCVSRVGLLDDSIPGLDD